MKIAEYLKKQECTLLSQAGRVVSMGNSILTSVPVLRLEELFPDLSHVELTATWVKIRGASNESSHFHSSHLVACVVRGMGWLRTNSPDRPPVTVGDVVVIPRWVNHFFDPDLVVGLDYIAYEVSDTPIDYQKHYREEAKNGIQR